MRKLIMVLALVALVGCKPTPNPVPPSTTDTLVVVDTTHSGGSGGGDNKGEVEEPGADGRIIPK